MKLIDKDETQRVQEIKLQKLNLKMTKLNAPDKGFIYLVTSPSFEGWVKLGQTSNVKTRYRSYNHANPRKDFKLDCYKEVENKYRAELLLIEELKEFSIKSSGREWFKVKNKNKVINIINNYTDRKITIEELIKINKEWNHGDIYKGGRPKGSKSNYHYHSKTKVKRTVRARNKKGQFTKEERIKND